MFIILVFPCAIYVLQNVNGFSGKISYECFHLFSQKVIRVQKMLIWNDKQSFYLHHYHIIIFPILFLYVNCLSYSIIMY